MWDLGQRRTGNLDDAFNAWFGLMLKRDEAGRSLFYPWRGHGYLLPSAKREEEIRRALKILFVAGIVGVLAMVAWAGVLHGLMAIALLCIAYFLLCTYLVRGLPLAQPSPGRSG